MTNTVKKWEYKVEMTKDGFVLREKNIKWEESEWCKWGSPIGEGWV